MNTQNKEKCGGSFLPQARIGNTNGNNNGKTFHGTARPQYMKIHVLGHKTQLDGFDVYHFSRYTKINYYSDLLKCGDVEANPGPLHKAVSTAIAHFVFDTEITDFIPLVTTLKTDCCYGSCNGECYDLPSILFQPTDKKMFKILSQVMWDGMTDIRGQGLSTIMLPYRFYSLFDDCDITSEYECISRLLMLAGDIETNPGPVMSKLNIQRNEPRIFKAHMGFSDLAKEFSVFNKNLDELKILQSSFDHVSETVNNLVPMLSTNITASTQLATDSFISIKDDMIKYGILLCLVQGIFVVGAKKTGLCAALLLAAHWFKVDKWLLELINELIAKVQTPKAHMHIEDALYDPYTNTVAKVVFGIVALFAVKKIPGKQDWDNYLMRLDRIPKAVEGSKKIWKLVSTYLDAALDQVKMMVLGQNSKEFSAHYSIAEDIENWTKEVHQYIQLEQRKKLTYDAEIANKVATLYPRGQAFLANPTLPAELVKVVKNFIHPAYMLYKHVHESPTGSAGPKQRPTVLWLVGDSQIGKSTLIWNICADMLSVMGYKELSYLIYARQCETNYWDGYFFQPVVVYDDAFSKKDDKTVPNPEIFETIRSCNNFPQHLPMAAIPDKNTYAKMQMMLYTSNTANVQLESITNPEAFWNRMNDNCYRVTLKPEFAKTIVVPGKKTTQRLDLSKVPKKANGKSKIDESMYLFQKQVWDLNENKFCDVGAPIEYEELRQTIYEDWKCKGELFLDHTQDLKERMERGWKAHMLFSNLLKKECQIETQAEVHYAEADDFEDAIDSVQFVQDKIMEITLQNSDLDNHELKIKIMDWFCENEERWQMFQNYQRNHSKTYLSSLKEKFIQGTQTCQSYVFRCMNAMKEVATKHPYLVAVGALSLVVGIGTLIYSLMGKEEEEEVYDAELAHSGSSNHRNQQKVKAELAHSGTRNDKTQQKFKAENFFDTCNDAIIEQPTLGYTGPMGWLAAGVMKKYKLGLFKDTKEFAAHMEIAAQYDVTNEMIAHAVCDPNAHEIVTSKIRDNTFRLSISHDKVMEGNVTFICGKIFVMPYHYLTMMHTVKVPLDTEIYLSQECFKKRMMCFKLSHLLKESPNIQLTENVVHAVDVEGKKLDLVFVNLHRELSYPLKDIRNLFISRDSQSKLVNGSHHGAMTTFGYYKTKNPDEMVSLNRGICRDYKSFNDIKLYLRERKLDVSVPGGKPTYMNICNYYEMNGISTPGDCGSILCIYDRRLNDGKAIAMHNGGIQCQSMAIPMCREMIEANIARWTTTCAHFSFQEPTVFVEGEPELPKGKFVAIGKSSLKVSHPVQTIIRKSKLYGYLREPTKKPAALVPFEHEGEMYDPIMKGLEKCGGDCELLDNDIIRECAAAVSSEINRLYVQLNDDSYYKRFLTYSEAVKGVDDDYMRSINRISSPGFPYMCEKKKLPGKMPYLGANEEFDCDPENFKTADAKRAYDETMRLIDNCSKGILTDVIWVDTKKDELRPISKISTRMFAAGPMHFVIALRMYFLPFCSWIMHNRLNNGIAVGVNPFTEWDKLAKLLLSKSDKVIAGDFSNYDGSLNSQVLWSIFHDVYIPWVEMMHGGISPRDYKICFGLWCHIVHSVHLNGDNLYMWTHSQPSGNPLTAILNSIYNKLILRMAWNKIFSGNFDFDDMVEPISAAVKESFVKPPPYLISQEHFSVNICEETYGDDHCINVSDKVIMWFNQMTLTKALASLGHVYTEETKSGKISVFRSLPEIQFLKRGFRFDENLQKYVGPLDESVIYEMMNWIRLSKTNVDETYAMKENCEVAMREMVYHGEEKYNHLISDLKKNIARFSKNDLPIFFPYSKQLRDVRAGYDIENLSWF